MPVPCHCRVVALVAQTPYPVAGTQAVPPASTPQARASDPLQRLAGVPARRPCGTVFYHKLKKTSSKKFWELEFLELAVSWEFARKFPQNFFEFASSYDTYFPTRPTVPFTASPPQIRKTPAQAIAPASSSPISKGACPERAAWSLSRNLRAWAMT